MINPIVLPVLAAMLLTSCDQVGTDAPTLTAAEFRAAAESRIEWRDPDLPADASSENWISAKILGFNDFHGNLNGRLLAGRPVGGAAVLAAYLQAEAAEVGGRAIIVHAGDHVGASPPVSALMQDEPAIQFLNLLANEDCRIGDVMNPRCNVVGTLGNHEFDDGKDEILRLLFGGEHASAATLNADWQGAEIPYVSANVLVAATGEPLLPAYVIKDLGGVPVAFIGAVLENAGNIVTPAGVAGLEFVNEAVAINRLVPELQARGVRAIIVAIHQGVRQVNFGDDAIVGQNGLQGNIINIVAALDDEIDVVVSGHAHAYTNVLVANASGKKILLTQAFSGGSAYDDIDISLDPVSGDIVEKSAAIMTTWADQGPGLTPDADIAALVADANIRVQPLVSRIVGVAAMDITRAQNDAGESALGNLIADAQRTAMDGDFAFMAPDGIRGNITTGDIPWGDLFTIHPFGNDLMAMTLTGEQIVRLLNQQWADPDRDKILQVSGLSFTWDASRPRDDRIVEVRDAAGTALDPAASYRIITNNFLASGGDNFSVFAEGTDRVVGPGDLDAMVSYIRAQPGLISAQIEGRITRLN